MEHLELVAQAKDAIGRVFSDRSVSSEETIDSLEELQDDIIERLEALYGDVRS